MLLNSFNSLDCFTSFSSNLDTFKHFHIFLIVFNGSFGEVKYWIKLDLSMI